ncbi:hypothetical protein PPYR_01726 [Photinus pyralis]|uniref:Uncharacterized protein n=3 Tax=Photinus pyralis TaxID=7054 RepID=A0A1Y1N305_PHOPY|nr:hypothetical protein PPYR_01726 [Photinus pyralis]
MCRYILHNCHEKIIQHPVKTMFGNGLKPEVWQAFQQRYNVPQMYEFYGSTEGNIILLNFDNKIGSIGFIPPYLQKYSPFQLVKYCEVTAEPIRDKNGFCIRSDVHEPGLAVGLIAKGGKRRSSSLRVGYLDPYETDKKILHGVFESGDQYFNSGDVLSYDELGYYYFVDRLGDTFRWKGENVSTYEVETIVSNIIGLQDAVAYGVKIPGCEGKGGMVSVSLDHRSLNMDEFLKTLKERLPSYAIPIFIRFNYTSALTSTFKYDKQQLSKDGFNIFSTQDVILYHNSSLGSYERLTPEIYEDIHNNKIKF